MLKGPLKSWILFLTSLWIAFTIAHAATTQEIDTLRAAASELGIVSGTWNFSTDPCLDGWRGIICCSNASEGLCCGVDPTTYPPPSITGCNESRTATARVSMIILRSDLFGQVLRGKLSESLCNLPSLTILDLGLHQLTGQIPACIGTNLSSLVILRIGDNRLTGTIPPELGSLSNLQQLYIDVTNISGNIPASLGRLSSLVTLGLRSNAMEGDIPPELGSLSNLADLELQVNRLTGGIPSTFVNLTSLRIFTAFNNELSGELDAAVFQNMARLATLNLRNNRFTGSVPVLQTSRLTLTNINLGLNEFSGAIPSELGGLPALRNLFLDHNQLNGTIPSSFSSFPTLVRMDLSHNNLVGTLEMLQTLSDAGVASPQGVPQLDVSFNNFDTSTAPRAIPAPPNTVANPYFNCIFSSPSTNCSRASTGGKLAYAVNIGGSATTSTSSDNGVPLQFSSDTETVTSNHSVGFFYGNGPWGLELSGDKAGIHDPPGPLTLNMSQAGGAQPELYANMRWSSSYIAFHVNELEAGGYVVTLHFAELVFNETGYRTFDVIVQGERIKEKLDIVKEVGPRAAYRLSKNLTVLNGSVSVQLVFTGPDRFLPAGAWPVESTGPVLSAVSVVSVDYRGERDTSGSLSTGQIIGIAVGSVSLLGILLVAVAWIRRRRRRKPERPVVQTSQLGPASISFDVAGALTYEELYAATEGFKEKLGEGGFGAVFKGTLGNGAVVAVKQLLKHNQQIEDDFKKEISIISKVRHRNLLAVIGYSLESDVPMLVCEYIPNGSLDKWLFRRRNEKVLLSWDIRRKIATEVACGLAYLHDESEHRIIHCDVKPANILLDSDFTPRIADFGLARLYDEKESHVTATRLKGTAGYLAPEYAMHLQLSDKVDVYSFGVVLLEILSGRRAVEFAAPSERVVLVEWAHKEAQIPSNLLEIIDERLLGEYVEQEARDMTTIAILCTQRAPSLRPKMQTVWLMLNGSVKVPEFLENLNSVIHTGSSDGSGSTGKFRIHGEGSISEGFGSLRVVPTSGFDDSFSERSLTD